MPQGHWSDPTVIASVINALAMVVYVGITAGILKASRDNTKATRDIFEAAYRPYLSVSTMKFGPSKHRPQERIVLFELKNSGSVPATEFHCAITAILDGKARPANVHADSPSKTLFPNETTGVFYFPGEEELARIADVMFSVKISYRGVNGQKHGYEGRYHYHPRTDFFVPVTSDFH
jgi:hypothetical protein